MTRTTRRIRSLLQEPSPKHAQGRQVKIRVSKLIPLEMLKSGPRALGAARDGLGDGVGIPALAPREGPRRGEGDAHARDVCDHGAARGRARSRMGARGRRSVYVDRRRPRVALARELRARVRPHPAARVPRPLRGEPRLDGLPRRACFSQCVSPPATPRARRASRARACESERAPSRVARGSAKLAAMVAPFVLALWTLPRYIFVALDGGMATDQYERPTAKRLASLLSPSAFTFGGPNCSAVSTSRSRPCSRRAPCARGPR